MKEIVAKWNPGVLVDADTLPMCSYSERDEMVLIDAGWEYDLPDGYSFFPTLPTMGEYIPVVGINNQGKKEIIGYACPVVYVLMGEVYSSFDECQNSEFFHPADYAVCRMEAVESTVQRQKEALEGGYYGD